MDQNNTEAGLSLHEQLAKAVEHKSSETVLKSPWKFDAEDDLPLPNVNPEGEEPSSTTDKPQPDQAARPKISEEIKKTSAETSTMLFDSVLKIAGGIIVSAKFKKRFNSEEMKTILEKDLEDKSLDEVDAQDLLLKKKFDRLLKQRDRKNNAIALDDDEHATVYDAFYQYYKVKDISMPPEALLYFTLGSILASRTLEIAFD